MAFLKKRKIRFKFFLHTKIRLYVDKFVSTPLALSETIENDITTYNKYELICFMFKARKVFK